MVASADELAPRVGQRPAVGGEDFLQRRCARPGCYVWFGVAHDQCSKRFCSVACRLALRRVLDREARYRARRQRWLIIDEFGFDKIERSLCPHATSLWYKFIDARSNRASTALVTNIDFEAWDKYLGDPQLTMAMRDRVVEGATIVKLTGRFYRVHRGDKPSQ